MSVLNSPKEPEVHFKQIQPIKSHNVSPKVNVENELAALMRIRRKKTSLIRDQMFQPETNDQYYQKFLVLKKHAETEKQIRLKKYDILKANITIDTQVNRTKDFYKKAVAREDAVNKQLYDSTLRHMKHSHGRVHSSIDQHLMDREKARIRANLRPNQALREKRSEYLAALRNVIPQDSKIMQ